MNSSFFKYVIDEVNLLHCRDPAYGFLSCKCPERGAVKTIPLVCKSRICPSCEKKYANEWADKLDSTLYAMSHRFMMFTNSEVLREVLGVNHSLL